MASASVRIACKKCLGLFDVQNVDYVCPTCCNEVTTIRIPDVGNARMGKASGTQQLEVQENQEIVIRCGVCGHEHGVYSPYDISGKLFLEIAPCPECTRKKKSPEQNSLDASIDKAFHGIQKIINAENGELLHDACREILTTLATTKEHTDEADKLLGLVHRIIKATKEPDND
jgi:hypothetical protein